MFSFQRVSSLHIIDVVLELRGLLVIQPTGDDKIPCYYLQLFIYKATNYSTSIISLIQDQTHVELENWIFLVVYLESAQEDPKC